MTEKDKISQEEAEWIEGWAPSFQKSIPDTAEIISAVKKKVDMPDNVEKALTKFVEIVLQKETDGNDSATERPDTSPAD